MVFDCIPNASDLIHSSKYTTQHVTVVNTELASWQSPIILQGPPDISHSWMNEIYSGTMPCLSKLAVTRHFFKECTSETGLDPLLSEFIIVSIADTLLPL